MKRLAKAIGYTLSLVAVLATVGGHWIALQTVAWTCMIADFAKTETLKVAITKTFDGRHACGMCLAVRDGRQQEERESQKTVLNFEKGFDFVLETRAPSLPERSTVSCACAPVIPLLHADWIQSPPSPPPRAFAA